MPSPPADAIVVTVNNEHAAPRTVNNEHSIPRTVNNSSAGRVSWQLGGGLGHNWRLGITKLGEDGLTVPGSGGFANPIVINNE